MTLKTLRSATAPSWLRALPVGLLFVVSVAAAEDAPESTQGPLPEVLVTGTLIKSADKTQFNQVQTITPEDIQQSGAVTVADYLRFSAANSASSWGDDFAYGATGGAGIALRGLSEKYTLVLVDGQRVAPYGYPSNGSDTFVDLNTLPLNSIERIEIVKTGAVSQYGSDAITGVVNIITRKSFQGVEVSGGYGEATQGGEATRKVSVLAGLGDLQNDRYNITASASFFLQNGYTQADRSNTRNQNYTSEPFGGLTTGADYWEPAGAGNGGAALSSCPSGSTSVSAGSLLNGPGSGTACAVNTAAASYLHPHEERIDAKVHGTFKLTDSLNAFADVWDARNITIASPPTDSNPGYNGIGDSTTAYQYNPLTGGISQASNLVPASNPYNPYGVAVPLTYTFLGQPALETVRSNFYRAAAGLEGTFSAAQFGDWDWSASASHSQSSVDKTETGLESVAGLENILDNGVFDFSDPSATPNGLSGLYLSDQSEGISKLDTIDLSASTTKLLTLPAGPVGVGVGAQFLRQSEYVTNYSLQSQAIATPFYLQAIDGQRNVAAAYYQVNVPLVSTLTFSQSSRYDHYSDFGSAFSPRFALSYKPVDEVTAYASYGRGFRAPTLAETSQRNSSGVQTAADPYSPTEPNVPETYPELVGGNAHLQPEKTRNFNAGLEWSPDRATSVGLDWYKIVVHNAIGTSNIQTTIDDNNPSLVVRNPNGTIAYVDIDYQNLNSLTTQGLELTFRKSFATPVGTFTATGDWAYVLSFNQTSGGVTVDFAGNDGAIDTPYGASFPRWKGNTSLGWAFGEFDTVLTHLFTGPYVLTQMPGRVSPYSQINLTETYTGFKDFSLYATVSNLFNRAPPYDPLWLEFPNHTPYDPSLYSDEGRYVEVGVSYRFR